MSAACPRFGVVVDALLVDAADPDALRRRFSAALAARGLVYAGSLAQRGPLVVSSEGGQMTESDRRAIVDWLEREPAVRSPRVGPLTDLGDDDL